MNPDYGYPMKGQRSICVLLAANHFSKRRAVGVLTHWFFAGRLGGQGAHSAMRADRRGVCLELIEHEP